MLRYLAKKCEYGYELTVWHKTRTGRQSRRPVLWDNDVSFIYFALILMNCRLCFLRYGDLSAINLVGGNPFGLRLQS